MESGLQTSKKCSEKSIQKIDPGVASSIADKFLNLLDAWDFCDCDTLPTEDLILLFMDLGIVEQDHNWRY